MRSGRVLEGEADLIVYVGADWTTGPLPSSLNINVRLFLRALQIGLADKQGADFTDLLADLDRLTREAQSMPDADVGLVTAAGSMTIRFAKKHPSIAHRFLLVMLRSAPLAVLPDGTKPQDVYPMSLESLLWVTATPGGSRRNRGFAR